VVFWDRSFARLRNGEVRGLDIDIYMFKFKLLAFDSSRRSKFANIRISCLPFKYSHKPIRFKDYDKENLGLHFISIFHRTSSINASLPCRLFLPGLVDTFLPSACKVSTEWR
jgi:hypothetical protein